MIISNRMKNAILKDTNIEKLSNNEYLVYSHLNKYKNDDTNLLISSYLAGNVSKDLYNTINKNLYNKLKNNEINKKQYYNIFKKINSINIQMEIEINSNDHKISNNKLRYYFNDTARFENNSISLMECIFYTYFENIKETYSMKVKKDNDFYNIDFIDSQLEICDINNNLQNHSIKFGLQSEDDNPKIQIIADVNTYSILILIEKDWNFILIKIFKEFLDIVMVF